MKNFKGWCFCFLLTINLFVFSGSCKQPIEINSSLKIEELDSNYSVNYVNNKLHILIPDQLSAVFPTQLNGLKRTRIKHDQEAASATAYYGDNQYEINIIDDQQNNYSSIHEFNRKYRKLDSNNTIKSVRDGYKTIMILQPEVGITSITFVFKKRYLMSVTGTDKQTPYMVWRFLELNKFQKLDE